jgi:hypothetical protein
MSRRPRVAGAGRVNFAFTRGYGQGIIGPDMGAEGKHGHIEQE